MSKISLIIMLLLLLSISAFGQSIGGERNPLGGNQYTYSYACAPVQAEYGITCIITIKNGRSNVGTFYLGKYGSNSSFKVTWDNINGTGSVAVGNPEGGSGKISVNITKQCTTSTISENITSNKNISDCNVILTNTNISNNATVNISADQSIQIKPNTFIQNSTNVRLYLTGASVYAVNEMESEETNIEYIPYKAFSDDEFRLYQNIPNPFSGQTIISCNIPEFAVNSYIIINDAMGNLLKTIKIYSSGNQEIFIEGSALKPGIYFYSLIFENQLVQSRKMIVVN